MAAKVAKVGPKDWDRAVAIGEEPITTLAIVRKVAERRGGRAWAVSKPGEGSTFSLALPANTGGEA